MGLFFRFAEKTFSPHSPRFREIGFVLSKWCCAENNRPVRAEWLCFFERSNLIQDKIRSQTIASGQVCFFVLLELHPNS